jgi:hypothetical protein
MKKTGAVFCVAAVLVVLINASVWEGAASGSPGTDLPETGYYVATNSFPRNTVVDITNLENGKTVRAVVSAPLENPGLLAVLSRDAASAIGLPNRSIGRVRMNQPADPVAFSRFTEGLSSSGDPDHDPAAFVAANGINPELPGGEEPPAPQVPAASGGDEAPPAAGVIIAGTEPAGTGVTEAPESGGGETGALAAGDEPAGTAPPEDDPIAAAEGSGTAGPPVSGEETAAAADETGIDKTETEKTGTGNLEGAAIVDLPEPYVPPASAVPDEGITAETNPELVWIPLEETGGEKLIEPEPEDMAEVADILAPGDAGEPAGKGDIPEPGTALAEEPPGRPDEKDIFAGDYDLTLVPSEERPPESGEPVFPADRILPPVPETWPVPALPPSGLAGHDGAYGFPVPVITELEAGKYYLQLAASRNQDAVRIELAKIDEYWPLKVQVSERDSYPYRILVGPVNQGESRALLQRFKNSGYQNAFVRQGN